MHERGRLPRDRLPNVPSHLRVGQMEHPAGVIYCCTTIVFPQPVREGRSSPSFAGEEEQESVLIVLGPSDHDWK